MFLGDGHRARTHTQDRGVRYHLFKRVIRLTLFTSLGSINYTRAESDARVPLMPQKVSIVSAHARLRARGLAARVKRQKSKKKEASKLSESCTHVAIYDDFAPLFALFKLLCV